MKVGHMTLLPSAYWNSLTWLWHWWPLCRMLVLIHDLHQSVTKPTTIQALLNVYSQNHLHVLTRFNANYCIILSAILTHSYSWYVALYARFPPLSSPPCCSCDMHFCSICFRLCNSLLSDCHFHLLVAVLLSATGEPTSEQDTITELKHT